MAYILKTIFDLKKIKKNRFEDWKGEQKQGTFQLTPNHPSGGIHPNLKILKGTIGHVIPCLKVLLIL